MEIRRFNFFHFVWPHFFCQDERTCKSEPPFFTPDTKTTRKHTKISKPQGKFAKMQRNNTRLQRKIRKQNNKNTQKSPKPCFEIKIINIDNQTRVFHFEKLQTGSKFEIQTKLENKQVFETEPFWSLRSRRAIYPVLELGGLVKKCFWIVFELVNFWKKKLVRSAFELLVTSKRRLSCFWTFDFWIAFELLKN